MLELCVDCHVVITFPRVCPFAQQRPVNRLMDLCLGGALPHSTKGTMPHSRNLARKHGSQQAAKKEKIPQPRWLMPELDVNY